MDARHCISSHCSRDCNRLWNYLIAVVGQPATNLPSQQPTTFASHRPCGSDKKMFFLCHMILQGYTLKRRVTLWEGAAQCNQVW